MIIVAGHLDIKENSREAFIERSKAVVLAARDNENCLEFCVTADSIVKNRSNVVKISPIYQWDTNFLK